MSESLGGTNYIFVDLFEAAIHLAIFAYYSGLANHFPWHTICHNQSYRNMLQHYMTHT